MIYNYIKIITIFILYLYLYLSRYDNLTNLFYVSETVVPTINQNISTGKIIIDDSELEYRVQLFLLNQVI